jgi:hypothetical protein
MSDTDSSNIVPDDLGNSKTKSRQVSPSNSWCFTLNNWKKEEYSSIIKELEMSGKYFYVIGKEVGDKELTPHLQGYIALKDKSKKFRMTIFENMCIRDGLKCMRCSRAKGTAQQNLDYCSKEECFCSNIIPPKPVKIFEDWSNYPWALDLIKVIECDPEDRKIYWYWGKQGGGKTAFIKYCIMKHNAVLINGSASNMKNGIIEYEKKNGFLPTLIMNNMDFDKDMSRVSYTGYEEIKDMCFYSGKYEGGMVCGNEPHLIIFANAPPETENVKFCVVNID